MITSDNNFKEVFLKFGKKTSLEENYSLLQNILK